VGQATDAMEMTIDPASVYAYTQAIGDTNPAYPQGPDDAEGRVAPPSYAAVYALGAGSLSLLSAGIEPARLIHSGQEFAWTRSLRVGERITARGRIADVTRKRQLTFVSAEVVVTDATGEQVCRSLGTILVLPEPAVAPA
jgi:hypothetical protein